MSTNSQIEPEAMVEFAFRYFPSLGWTIAICFVIGVSIILAKRRKVIKWLRWWFVLLPIVVWLTYFVSTAKWTFTLACLNSEDDRTAENVYWNSFTQEVDLDQAVHLVAYENPHEPNPNLRFYAACRIADILATNNDQSVIEDTLKEIENAPTIQTGFFGTNGLNYKLYIPGREQLHISARSLIEQRIKDIRELKKISASQ
jgi:hypothetical protein